MSWSGDKISTQNEMDAEIWTHKIAFWIDAIDLAERHKNESKEGGRIAI